MLSNNKNLKRKRDEGLTDAESLAAENELLPMYPDAMLLVLREIGRSDCKKVSLVNSQFNSIFNHNSAWKKRFEQHFPHRKAARTEHGIDYRYNFRLAEQEEYSHIDDRIKAIIYAIKERDLVAIQALNLSYADLFAVDSRGKSVLEWMVTVDSQNMLDYAYRVICQHYVNQDNDHIIDPDYVNAIGFTRLHYAVLCSQSTAHLEDLIRFQGFDVNAVTLAGHTPLMLAAGTGRTSIAKYLLAMGANVHLTDVDGKSAIHFASSNNHVAVMRHLIQAKANVNHTTDDHTQTPLWSAASNGHVAIVDELLANSASSVLLHLEQTPLYIAAKNGHDDCVQAILVTDKTSINYVNLNDRTALFAAAKRGHIHCVRQLMCAGADWSIYDSNAHTPILIAAKNGHADVVALLVAYGANIDQVIDEEDGMTALLHAMTEDEIDLEMVAILLDNDADPNYQVPETQMTALHMAIIRGCMESLEMMMDANADPELEIKLSKQKFIHMLRSLDQPRYDLTIQQIEASDQEIYVLSAFDLAIYFQRNEVIEYIRDTLHPRVYDI